MKGKPVSARDILSDPVHLLAFGFGSGLVPRAPGTAGTAVALPFAWLFWMLPGPGWHAAVLLLAALLGIYLCGESARRIGVHDHGGIVWDEFVGMWLTAFFLPATIAWLLIGFVLFRFFDIVKPWPIRWLDRRVHGGAGIMLDDIVAALFAIGVGRLLEYALTLGGISIQ